MTDGLYIGLMSGTSMDGIDAVLVEIAGESCNVCAAISPPYPDELQERLRNLVGNTHGVDLAEIGQLHTRVARTFSDAVTELLNQSGRTATDIVAIGSHGQTVLHHPDDSDRFSMQLGDPGTLAAKSGITVVADFRNTDLALCGQGAPLVPAFHRWAFSVEGECRAVINIGGIANVTLLHADGVTSGFDTGPGNSLLDLWYREHHDDPYDDGGHWAADGSVDTRLLEQLRGDPYFAMAAPKSTGSDYFNLDWLRQHLKRCGSSPSAQDIQATLSELTAQEIAIAVLEGPPCHEVAICGGGAFNTDLLGRLRSTLPDCRVVTTAEWGIEPAWVEAAAFAWLAHQRLLGLPTNVPAVTGAKSLASLGGVYLPPLS
jgi:anhydro-N-acetylmuramic acid kinase